MRAVGLHKMSYCNVNIRWHIINEQEWWRLCIHFLRALAPSSPEKRDHCYTASHSLAASNVCQKLGEKKYIYWKNLGNISIGRRAWIEGDNQSVGPGSHLKAYLVTLDDSVTMTKSFD